MAEVPGTSTAATAAAPRDNNQALHEAIEKGDMEAFLDLLHQPGIDLNYKHGGETLLTASIGNGNSRMAKKLIETGCDVNLRNDKYEGPLNLAVKRQNGVEVTLVKMLLHKGADPNEIAPYCRFFTRTPLTALCYITAHSCLSSNILEVTSILLYYGADVTITDTYHRTPLQLAVHSKRNGCAEVLLNYYDDFIKRSCFGDGRSALDTAVDYDSPLVSALLERGADVNSLGRHGSCLLHQTEYHRNAKMFKYIWCRINHHLLMKTYTPFLLSYIRSWKFFANCEYLECFYLMLESPIAQDLIEHCIDYLQNYRKNLVRELLSTFKDRKILPKDRLSAIYTCLSFGIKIEMDDFPCAIENYGFNGEEFKALLYASDFNGCDCIEQIKYFKQYKEDFYLKGFSSYSFENKQHAEAVNELLATSSRRKSKRMLKALRRVPKFPSLLELSRNGAQKFIEQKFTVSKLYQFYDVVSCLKLPESMKDVILLEKPIYDDVTITK